MSLSILIPKWKYYSATVTITASSNDTVRFTEGGGNLDATITAGTYTWGALAQQVKIALEAAGAGTYTVTYSASTRKYTLTKSAGTFTLDVGGAAHDALPTLGFSVDKSAALTYTSDNAVPSQTTVTATRRLRYPDVADEVEREDFEAASGRRESALIRYSERLSFSLEFETTAVHTALKTMWREAGRYGVAIDFYPDSTQSDFVTVYWDQARFPMEEMVRSRGIYRHYAGDFVFRLAVPVGSSTLTGLSFDDRAPTS